MPPLDCYIDTTTTGLVTNTGLGTLQHYSPLDKHCYVPPFRQPLTRPHWACTTTLPPPGRHTVPRPPLGWDPNTATSRQTHSTQATTGLGPQHCHLQADTQYPGHHWAGTSTLPPLDRNMVTRPPLGWHLHTVPWHVQPCTPAL